MKSLYSLSIAAVLFISCTQSRKESKESEIANKNPKFIQIKYPIDLAVKTVGITNYTLISNNLGRDSSEAREIIKAKVALPLAMQKHDSLLFESVLASEFIYQGVFHFGYQI